MSYAASKKWEQRAWVLTLGFSAIVAANLVGREHVLHRGELVQARQDGALSFVDRGPRSERFRPRRAVPRVLGHRLAGTAAVRLSRPVRRRVLRALQREEPLLQIVHVQR